MGGELRYLGRGRMGGKEYYEYGENKSNCCKKKLKSLNNNIYISNLGGIYKLTLWYKKKT